MDKSTQREFFALFKVVVRGALVKKIGWPIVKKVIELIKKG